MCVRDIEASSESDERKSDTIANRNVSTDWFNVETGCGK